ncbi:MAG: NAD(P)-dependent oxidoreductase [Myxococcota bacterium]
MRILLTGATGFLGAHLVRVLQEEGHTLKALARASSRTEPLEERGVEVVRGSFGDRVFLREATSNADAIIHAAGGGLGSRDAIYQSNTESTRALLEAAPEGLTRFVLVSSLAAHGPSKPEQPARDGDSDHPRSDYGKSKLAAEAALWEHAKRFSVVSVRPPALYGPGEYRLVSLFRAAQRGVVPMVHPRGTLSLLDGRDCATAVARALVAPKVSGSYFVSETHPYRRQDFASLIGNAVGRDVRVVPVPVGALHWAARGAELVGRLRNTTPPLSQDKVRDASAPHQSCDPSRAIQELGWQPAHRFREGAMEAYEDYRARGWL